MRNKSFWVFQIVVILAFITHQWPDAYGQKNLVKNPGFEEYSAVPSNLGDWGKIAYWKCANATSPDLFSLDGTDKAQLPKVLYGKTNPYSGRSCIGLFFSGTEYVEYLNGELTEPLTIGKKYKVTFYITNGTSNSYASHGTSHLGIAFTDYNPKISGEGVLHITPQYKTSEPFYSTTWNKLSFVFEADKAYTYITVGLFTKSVSELKAINWPSRESVKFSTAYYFMDDISVVPTYEPVSVSMSALPVEVVSTEVEYTKPETVAYVSPKVVDPPKNSSVVGVGDGAERISSLKTPTSTNDELNSLSFVEESGTKITNKPKAEELPSFTDDVAAPPKIEAPTTTPEPDVVEPPVEVLGRGVEVQKIIESRRQKIKIKVWDGKEVDGDIIKLVLNGEVILDKFVLEKEAHVIEVTLTGRHNFLALHALNLGKVPPNTANISVSNEDGEIILELKSTLKNSGLLQIDYKP